MSAGNARRRATPRRLPLGMHLFPCTGCGNLTGAYRPERAACATCLAAADRDAGFAAVLGVPQRRDHDAIDPADIPF